MKENNEVTARDSERSSPSKQSVSDSLRINSSSLDKTPSSSSNYGTLVSLFGATFGISSLGLPIVMAQTGILMFLFLMMIALLVNFISYRIIIIYTETSNLRTFSCFAEAIGGPRLRKFVNIFFFISNIGTMISSIVVFNSLVTLVLTRVGFINTLLTDPRSLTWILVPILISIPILIKQELKNFAWITVISFAACIYLVILLTTNLIISIPEEKVNVAQLEYFNWFSLARSYAYIFYCFTCQQNIIGIYRESGHQNFRSIKPTLKVIGIFFAVIYITIAATGYIAFSSRKDELISKEIVMRMFEDNNHWALIANMFMIFTAYNAFLYTFKPTKEIIADFYDELITERLPEGNDQDIDQPIQLANPLSEISRNDSEVPQSDYQSKNVLSTLLLMTILLVISCIFVKKEIGFVEMLNFISDLITPVLFVFIPLVVYFRSVKKIYLLSLIIFSGGVYIWRIGEISQYLLA
jgi:amino acid permease